MHQKRREILVVILPDTTYQQVIAQDFRLLDTVNLEFWLLLTAYSYVYGTET